MPAEAKVQGLPDLRAALQGIVPKLRRRALRNALAAGADAVLLDNMDDATVREAVAIADSTAVSTVSTGIPFSLSALAVPPLDKKWKPSSFNCAANASRPVLSETERRAVFMGSVG